MSVQIGCKSHRDLIKKGYAPDNVRYGVFRHSRASNSEVKSSNSNTYEILWQC